MRRLRLDVLGGFSVYRGDGRHCVLPTRKSQALLAYLALPAGRFHTREKLTALLWGDTAELQARQSFRQALAAIRRALGSGEPPALLIQGDTVALNAAAASVDALELEAAVADGSRAALARVPALYKGDLLEGLAVDETPFDEWRVPVREHLRERALEGLAKLLREQMRADDIEPAIQTALRVLALDPLQEAVHRALMQALLRQGRRAAALQQYQQCAHVLRHELGTAPEAETRALYRTILQAPTPRDAARDRPEPRPVGALVGREKELRTLREAWAAARGGESRVVVVSGVAGIGKSRIVAELAADAAADGARVAVGRAHEWASAQPFAVWVDAVRTAGLLDDVELERPALIALGRIFPELNAPRPPATQAPGAAARARLFGALTELCRRHAERGPLVLVLEDLQWADEMSVECLAFLADRSAGRLLVVATTRREDARVRRRTLLEIGPLSRDATVTLIHAHARPVDRANASLIEQISDVTAGNPLAIVETVRALHDPDTPAHVSTLPLPQTIRETIGRRLDGLGEPAAQAASVAAVIGRDFDFDLLCRVTQLDASDAAEAIEELVDDGVLQASGDRLVMTHQRIQEVAYARPLAPVRRLWHQRVAASLEALARERGEPLEPATLAHHLTEAGLVPEALEYLGRAGQRALEQSAYAEAGAHARRELALVPKLADAAAGLAHELGAQLRLGEALTATRGYAAPEVQAAFARAREVCLEMGRPAAIFPAVAGLFHYYLTRGDVRTAATLAAQLLEMAESGPVEHGIIARLACGDAAFWAGDLQAARQHFARTRELAREGVSAPITFGGHDALVVGDLYSALACWLEGESDTALARVERATQRARELEHPHSEVLAVFFVAWVHRLRGELEQARARVDELVTLATRGGFLFWVLVGKVLTAYRTAELGDPKTAVAEMERGLAAYRAAGAELGVTFTLTLLAEAQVWAGRRDDALATLVHAQGVAHANGERFYEAELVRLRGELNDDNAEACFREALHLARAQGARALELRAATSLRKRQGSITASASP